MRSRLVARSARLALAAVAALALTGAATAAATADSRSTAAPACATDDLTFTVTEETQAGGYLFLTAKAKPGISCTLQGVFPSASFGSSPDSAVSPAEHAVSASITLEGSTTAYGINPKITNDDLGRESDQLHLSVMRRRSQLHHPRPPQHRPGRPAHRHQLARGPRRRRPLLRLTHFSG